MIITNIFLQKFRKYAFDKKKKKSKMFKLFKEVARVGRKVFVHIRALSTGRFKKKVPTFHHLEYGVLTTFLLTAFPILFTE